MTTSMRTTFGPRKTCLFAGAAITMERISKAYIQVYISKASMAFASDGPVVATITVCMKDPSALEFAYDNRNADGI